MKLEQLKWSVSEVIQFTVYAPAYFTQQFFLGQIPQPSIILSWTEKSCVIYGRNVQFSGYTFQENVHFNNKSFKLNLIIAAFKPVPQV